MSKFVQTHARTHAHMHTLTKSHVQAETDAIGGDIHIARCRHFEPAQSNYNTLLLCHFKPAQSNHNTLLASVLF